MGYNPAWSNGGQGGTVSSVFGRTGSVSAAANDYGWSQIASKPSTYPPDTHGHAWADLSNPPTTYAPSSHTHPASELSATGTASSATFLRGDNAWATPSGGSDPWTYRKLASDFTTTSATAVDAGVLNFTPVANTDYEFYGFLLIRTATTTVNPRVGLAWATGGTDGVAMIYEAQTATGAPINAAGNINASLLVAVGGLPNTTQSWPVGVEGIFRAGASPSGTVRLQLASETAGTAVRLVIGSFLRFRTY